MIVYGLKEDLSSANYIAGRDIFFDDIIKLCANTNAYTDNSNKQPVLSYENIIALNPDQIIILHSHATESGVDAKKALQAWYKLPTNASRNKNISIVDDDYLHIPSHRIALTIKRLSDEMNKNYNTIPVFRTIMLGVDKEYKNTSFDSRLLKHCFKLVLGGFVAINFEDINTVPIKDALS